MGIGKEQKKEKNKTSLGVGGYSTEEGEESGIPICGAPLIL